MITPGYVLTSDDLELGITDERGYVAFIFLSLGYITQYNISNSIHLPAGFMISFKGNGEVI